MKKDWFYGLATAILVLCALTVTALVVRRELFTPARDEVTADRVANWKSYAASGHRLGSERAPVTIVEFSDFQCPACRALSESLRSIRQRHPDRVLVVYRHFPLPNHSFAVHAARASECAADQGRFEAYHDLLFARQEQIGTVSWSQFAAEARVPDLEAFRRCVDATGRSAVLERDTLAGKKLGVSGTPTLLINGLRITGAPPLPALEELIGRELDAGETAAAGAS